MKSAEFCYWLQGMFELTNPKKLNAEQTEMIRKHLSLVFIHELDATHGDSAHQAVLNEVHTPFHSGPTHGADGNVLFRC